MMRASLMALAAAALLMHMAASQAFAADKLFERDYLYRASEADSKLSCRAIALEQVKRLLLEELGTYLVSETVVRDAGLTKDEVTTITAGIVRSDIKEERWDGETYYIKIEVVADPDSIAAAVNEMAQERQGVEELKESQARADAAMKELDKLRAELAEARKALDAAARAELAETAAVTAPSQSPSKPPAQAASAAPTMPAAPTAPPAPPARQVAEIEAAYRDEVGRLEAEDLWKQGHALFKKKRCEDAIAYFDRALAIEPMMARAYANRGACNLRLKRFEQALADFNEAIEGNPNRAKWYIGRSKALERLKRHKEARKDLERAAALGSPDAKRMLRREF